MNTLMKPLSRPSLNTIKRKFSDLNPKTGKVISPDSRKKLNDGLKTVTNSVNLVRKNVSQVAVDQALENNYTEIENLLDGCNSRISQINEIILRNQLQSRVKRPGTFAEKLVKAGKFESIEEFNEFKKSQ